ncbi:MAG: radical SAM protein [Deltaproteobacteria bacterium]|nr:radical SAM protein [Candidatus Tharpella sp.]
MSTPKLIDPDSVFALVANRKGDIFDHPEWLMLGAAGRNHRQPESGELIPLPKASRLFFLPDCPPLGWDPKEHKKRPINRLKGVGNSGLQGVAAFLPPAYSRFLLPAVSYQNKKYTLPLWAYTAVGWSDEVGYVTTACRVDKNRQWEPEYFDDREVVAGVDRQLARYPKNRLIDHIGRCAIDYHCFAAKNFFLERWECPLPVSPTCNANCIGCLSQQEEEKIKKGVSCPASQERINFVPTVTELLEIALPHIEIAENPVLSFGQGCEGDPIMQSERICEFARAVRKTTSAGTLNVNTNASLPEKVTAMAKAGMDSIRVSLNSARSETYLPYYRPKNYTFANVLESLRAAKEGGLHLALNLLVMPGVSDAEAEVTALLELIDKYQIDQIQMRNLCIDPRQYCDLFSDNFNNPIGIVNLLKCLHEEFPKLHVGYFNRFLG